MSTILTILHVLVCLFLMLTVLLQAGKGGGMGAAFGGGSSSGTVFGGSGAGNFLKKLTVGAAVVFVFTSMSLAYIASSSGPDALKSFSAQNRHNLALKKEQHEAATKAGAAPAAGEGGEGVHEGDTGEPAVVAPEEAGPGTPPPAAPGTAPAPSGAAPAAAPKADAARADAPKAPTPALKSPSEMAPPPADPKPMREPDPARLTPEQPVRPADAPSAPAR